jgi:hypothetical protein
MKEKLKKYDMDGDYYSDVFMSECEDGDFYKIEDVDPILKYAELVDAKINTLMGDLRLINYLEEKVNVADVIERLQEIQVKEIT